MEKEKLEAILVEYGVPFTDALSDRLIKEFDTPSGEYIKKEDALRAVYGMARPTGIDEMPYEYAENAIYDLPTYSIPEREKGEPKECARILKKHCFKTKNCRECFMWYECEYQLSAPCDWDLPESEE